jgi:alanyl-tRNA synthetase
MAQILQSAPNNYETDLIFPIVSKAAELAGVNYAQADGATQTSLKARPAPRVDTGVRETLRNGAQVIGDHTRAVVYLISDGVTPSNVGRGYVVRRLLRRVVLKVGSIETSDVHGYCG